VAEKKTESASSLESPQMCCWSDV